MEREREAEEFASSRGSGDSPPLDGALDTPSVGMVIVDGIASELRRRKLYSKVKGETSFHSSALKEMERCAKGIFEAN